MPERHLHVVPPVEDVWPTTTCWRCFKEIPECEAPDEPICDKCWDQLTR